MPLPKYEGIQPPKARGIYWGEVWIKEAVINLLIPKPVLTMGLQQLSLLVDWAGSPNISAVMPVIGLTTTNIYSQEAAAPEGNPIPLPSISVLAEIVS